MYRKIIPYISPNIVPYWFLTLFFSRKITPAYLAVGENRLRNCPSPSAEIIMCLLTVGGQHFFFVSAVQVLQLHHQIQKMLTKQPNSKEKVRTCSSPTLLDSQVRGRPLQPSVGIWRKQTRQMYLDLWNIPYLFSSFFFAWEGYVIFFFLWDVNDLRSSVLFNLWEVKIYL